MNSHLRITIIKILSKKEMTGYDISKEIYMMTDGWKPSFGSIYPLLKDLHNKKLITVRTDGRKKIYRITPLGEKWFKEFYKSKEEVLAKIFEDLKQFKMICDKKEFDFIMRWHNHIHNNPAPFKDLNAEVYILAELLMKLSADEHKFQKHKQGIKTVLSTTIKKLREIDRS